MPKKRAFIANPLPKELFALARESLPDLEIVYRPDLLRPARWTADYRGDSRMVRSSGAQREFLELSKTCEILFGIPDYDLALLKKVVECSRVLEWVQVNAAGGGADVAGAELRPEDLDRIIFTTVAGVQAEPLAEFCLMVLLAGAKDLPRLLEQKARKYWGGRWPVRQFEDMTIVIYGLGGIGVALAKKLKFLQARVLGVSRRLRADLEWMDAIIAPKELESALRQADGLVITLPSTSLTYHAVGQRLFSVAKPGLILCNVGRGSVVDEAALVRALKNGRVGFAGLDVTEIEPLPKDSELWSLPNVITAPHTGGLSRHEERRVIERFIDNARALLAGQELSSRVNTAEFY